MELTEDQNFEKCATRCKHCMRNTLLPYENERTCAACGYNVFKRKRELTRKQRTNKFYQSFKIR